MLRKLVCDDLNVKFHILAYTPTTRNKDYIQNTENIFPTNTSMISDLEEIQTLIIQVDEALITIHWNFAYFFFILPINFAVASGNGNMQINRRQLKPEEKECPAPQSHTIIYRLAPLNTPLSSH